MRIRMVHDRPGMALRGAEIDVPDEEGAAVCEQGWAVPVAQAPAEEHAVVAEPAEERAARPARPPRQAKPA
jgi:hypothetical protein